MWIIIIFIIIIFIVIIIIIIIIIIIVIIIIIIIIIIFRPQSASLLAAAELGKPPPCDVPVIQDRTEVIRIRYAANVTSADDDIGQVTSVFTHTESLRNETTGKLTGLDSRMTIYVLTSTGRIFKFHARIGAQMDGLDLDRLDPGLSGEGDRLHLPLPGAPTPTPYPVLSARHFYLLAGNTLIRRPLDPCLAISSCIKCISVPGCGWCVDRGQCGLLARCERRQRCVPEVDKMAPESGPVTGNTTLTLHVLGMVEQNFVVTVCHRPCPVMVGSPSNPLGTIKCRVPESVNQTERRCAVAIQFPDGLGLDATATQSFFYTVPELYDFTPTRMLGAEPGTLIFKGKHLDSGSDVTVLGNGTILCRVASRNSSQIWCQLQSPISSLSSQRCYNLTLTIDGLDLTWTKSRSPSDPTLTPLSRRDLPGAVARRLVHPPGLFCRLPNPVVSAVHSNWTFRGGNVTMRVNGHHLDVAFVTVLLTVSGQQQSDNRACAVCPDVTDGTCLLCRTPDVRRLTSQGSAASASAEVSFEMKGRQSLQSVRHSNTTGPISIAVLSDPRFHLVKPGNSCLAVQESDKLSIQGSFLPPGVPYTLTVGGCQCEPTPRLFPLSPSSSSSSVLSCRLQSVWACLPASTTTTPTTKTSQVGKCDLNRDSSSSHGSGRSCTWNVEIHIEGRRFLAGCVSSVPEAPLHKIGVGVIVGAAVGGFLFLLLVCFCSCRYVRYRKRKFYRKRYINRHSGVSDGTLLSSEYGGSAEGRYISLDRLLNPEGDPEKQCEIEASGIIIRRRFLDLGNVVGHGNFGWNFGCVFEGRYQTEEGNDDSWQKVAVKTLISPAIHAIDLKTFIDEAMLMKNFDHRHVLGLLGLSEGDHGPLVVLPFMERGDILAYVKNEETELNLGDVLQFSVDIASGMGYLASSKFVHRDLAARNCMLDDDLRVKVADFGLCRDVYEKGYYHSDNRKKLPIRWMPPESIEKGTYTSKSDVWSMGVVMWEMLTRGITPYPGVEGWDILRYLVAGRRLDQPALCPDSVYALVERCWRLEPWERPTFRDIERDLRSLTSSLQDPHAPYTPTHLLTPITVPACHGFKDDAAIVAKVKEAMNRRAYSPEPSSSPPASASSPPASASFLAGSGEGEAAEGMEVGSRSAPVSDQGPASSRSERSSRVPEVSDLSVQQPEGGGVSTVAVPATDDHETLDHLSVESGPVLTYPRLPEVKDDGYFLLEQEAVLPPSTQPLRHSQGDSIATPGGVEAAVFVSPSSAHGEGLLAGSSDSLVTWRRVTELRTMAGMDDGYFQLEREESTQV
ncbi:hypothetical protein ACOMHN_030899 [Nucella lapillus]